MMPRHHLKYSWVETARTIWISSFLYIWTTSWFWLVQLTNIGIAWVQRWQGYLRLCCTIPSTSVSSPRTEGIIWDSRFLCLGCTSSRKIGGSGMTAKIIVSAWRQIIFGTAKYFVWRFSQIVKSLADMIKADNWRRHDTQERSFLSFKVALAT